MVEGQSSRIVTGVYGPTPTTSSTSAVRRDIYDLVPARGFAIWNRRPVVVDAGMLMNDILNAARGRGGSLLLLAASKDVANLYATEQVREEVERHLERRAIQGYVAPERAFQVWHEHYLPVIRFVSLAGVPRGRAARLLADRDPTDLPTGVLAELLAPCLVFAHDRDLTDTGIARKDWTGILHNAEEAKQLEMLLSGGSFATLVFGSVGVEAAQGVVRLARAAPIPTLIAAILLAIAGHRHFTGDRGRRQIRDGKSVATEIGGRLGEVIQAASAARDVVRSAAFVLEVEPTELAHAVRAVAVAPYPPRAGEVAVEIGVSTQKATSLLRDPVFTRTSDGTYLLGMSYAPVEVRAVPYPELPAELGD